MSNSHNYIAFWLGMPGIEIYKLIKEEEEFLKNLQKEAVDGKS